MEHMIRPEELAVDDKNCESVHRAVLSIDQTYLRSILGVCNVFRRSLFSFARVAAPMHVVMGKSQPFEFKLNSVRLDAFQELNERMMSPLILALPGHEQRYTLASDGCN